MRRDIADSAEYSRSPVIAGLPGFHAVQFLSAAGIRFPAPIPQTPACPKRVTEHPTRTHPNLISFFQGQFVASAAGTTPRA